jgi:hypothetical protein
MDDMRFLNCSDLSEVDDYRNYIPKELEEAYDLFAMRQANEPITQELIESHRQMALALRSLKHAGVSKISEITKNDLCNAVHLYEGYYKELAKPMKNLIAFFKSEGLMDNDLSMPTPNDIKLYERSLRKQDKAEEKLKFDEIDKFKSEELRDRAITLLATKTGASAECICGMEIVAMDLNAKRSSTVEHKKSDFPPDVENAIFEYVANGRPDIDCKYLFMMTNYPARPVRLAAVEALIEHASKKAKIKKAESKARKRDAV